MKKYFLWVTFLATCSTTTLFAQITDPAPYCNGVFDDMNGTMDVPDQINKVSLGALSNSSATQSDFPHYIYYNNLAPVDFAKNSAYDLSIDFDVHGGAGYGAWIDYNHDNDFSSDEKVSGTDATHFLDIAIGTVITETITIPPTALSGTTRMRVRIVEDDSYTGSNGANILPCNAGTSAADIMDWGETEDYDINIVESAPGGIQEINNNIAFSIRPNPAQSTLAVDIAFSGRFSYKIYSITGESIITGMLSEDHEIDISSLKTGIYFIQLFDQEKTLGQYKFLKYVN